MHAAVLDFARNRIRPGKRKEEKKKEEKRRAKQEEKSKRREEKKAPTGSPRPPAPHTPRRIDQQKSVKRNTDRFFRGAEGRGGHPPMG